MIKGLDVFASLLMNVVHNQKKVNRICMCYSRV